MGKKQGNAEEQEAPSKYEAKVVDAEGNLDVAADADDDAGEVPDWMQEEQPDSSDEGDEGEDGQDGEDEGDEGDDETSEKGRKVPEEALIKIKQKLKGKLNAEKEENQVLKDRIAELEKGEQQAPPALERPKRPRRADFQSDDEHEDAMDAHDEALANFIPQNAAATADQQAEVEAAATAIQTSVDEHIDRASKLIVEHQIDPDVYHASQEKVKTMMGALVPKNVPKERRGENTSIIFNQIIDTLGEGSEKVMFYIGRNKGAAEKLESLMLKDKTGLKAVAYLAAMNEKISGNKNITSRSPRPTKVLKGGNTPAAEKAAKRKYDDATRKGDNAQAFKIKRAAKKDQKIDTSKW